MMTEQKNIAIAEMLGAVKENWYPANKDNGSTGNYYIFPTGKWYPNNKRQHGDYALKFHSDANWQFEAIDWVEKQNVIGAEYASNYNFISSCFSCEIETTGYRSSTIINVENQNRKEAIFEALYQFSKYMKENGSK